MRFSSAVDSLTKENQFLRFSVKSLTFTSLILALTVIFLHDRSPVVVERSSRGLEIVKMSELIRSENDLELALRLMIKARFDSESISSEVFLSNRQLELKNLEQKEMKSRGLVQNIVFRKAQVSKEEAIVEFDRILSIGEIRSALKTTVKVAFEETEPNELNPYGLKLALAVPLEKKEEKK